MQLEMALILLLVVTSPHFIKPFFICNFCHFTLITAYLGEDVPALDMALRFLKILRTYIFPNKECN